MAMIFPTTAGLTRPTARWRIWKSSSPRRRSATSASSWTSSTTTRPTSTPWFLESKKDRTNPKADWYIWRDAKPDGSAPTNWRAIFGGSAWKWCEERQQYYLHTFAEAQPDLNWENPEVRQALFDAANFWLDKGVGGFRIDAIVYIKKPEFKDGPVDGATASPASMR